MPVLRRGTAPGVALVMALVAQGSGLASLDAQPAPAVVRFHHAHYSVDDPSAAMAEALRRVEGVRVIAQGLGVGVRTGSELLLFDRRAPDAATRTTQPAAAAFARTIDRLKAWGLSPQPQAADQVRATAVFPDLEVDHLAFSVEPFEPAVRQLVEAGAPLLSRTADAVFVDGGDVVIEVVRATDREETHWCPMHPDVRSTDPGTCPLCAMDLVPIPPPKFGEYGLDVTAERERGSGTIRRLRFVVREPDTNAVVTDLQVMHERTFHLFIVGDDLAFFDHVHPERQPDGSYVLEQPLPPGEYMLIADFLPSRGTTQMVQRAVISGRPPRAGKGEPSLDSTVRSASKEGITVTLDAAPARAGREVPLVFTVTDARTGAPVTDLEPYLGAPAHMLLVRSDLTDAVHAHPEEVATGGPAISFHPLLPGEGAYKLWLQVQRRGRIITVPFVLRTGM